MAAAHVEGGWRVAETRPVRVPAIVRAKGGERWVAELPRTVVALEDRWGITVGPASSGGTWAYVARVVTETGDPAVLRISVPEVGFDREIRTLLAAGGRGYVRVLAVAADRDAVLLEPLGDSVVRSTLLPEVQLDVLAALLPTAWQVSPGPAEAEDKAAGLVPFIEQQRGPATNGSSTRRCVARTSGPPRPTRTAACSCTVTRLQPTCCAAPRWLGVHRPGRVLGDPDYDRGLAARDGPGADPGPGRVVEGGGVPVCRAASRQAPGIGPHQPRIAGGGDRNWSADMSTPMTV
jgi:hypothetical protein